MRTANLILFAVLAFAVFSAVSAVTVRQPAAGDSVPAAPRAEIAGSLKPGGGVFFDDAARVAYYAEIERMAAKKNLVLAKLSYSKEALQGLNALVVDEVTYTLAVSGTYSAARSFFGDLTAPGRCSSVKGFRFYSAPRQPGDVVLEMELARYSLAGIRKQDYSKLSFPAARAARPREASASGAGLFEAPPDIFQRAREKRKVSISVEAGPSTSGVEIKKGLEVRYEVSVASSPVAVSSEVETRAAGGIKLPPRFSLKYCGFVSGKRLAARGMIEYNGRILLVSPGTRLGDEYEVLSLDSSSAVLRLADDPLSTVELRLKK